MCSPDGSHFEWPGAGDHAADMIEGMIMMNYIKEINAFYDCLERHLLSASAVTLWHALMHINNKAMWIESFTVAAPYCA